MAQKTSIEWTDHTFNPWWGCVEVSPACDHCYAKTLANRYGHHVWGKDDPRRTFSDKHWLEPHKWNKEAQAAGIRKRVFCGSMCDVMEDRRDLDEQRERLFRLIEETPFLDWQLLTKRPQNFRRFLPKEWLTKPLSNVWGMTTVESQEHTWRVLELLNTPFAVRGISAEPLLGPLDLTRVDTLDHLRREMVRFARWDAEKSGNDPEIAAKKMAKQYPPKTKLPKDSWPWANALTGQWFDGWDSGRDASTIITWVIAGGESGPGARPVHPDWIRSLRDQCADAGVSFFFKQWGDWVPSEAGKQSHLPADISIKPLGPNQVHWLYPDGSHAAVGSELVQFPLPSVHALKIGDKKNAGALLDGLEHKAFPQIGERSSAGLEREA